MQNVKTNEDLRVRRTRKMLQEALIELTVEKGFAAVTVQDISERAMVNRSTFYRHYPGGKYDLLEQYANEVTGLTWQQDFSSERPHERTGKPSSGLVNLLKHVQMFADFYRVMLGQNGDPGFTQRFRQNIEKRFRYLLAHQGADSDPQAPPVDMRLQYVSSAGVGAMLWWLESGQPCSVEQLATWLSKLNMSSAGLSIKPTADLPGTN